MKKRVGVLVSLMLLLVLTLCLPGISAAEQPLNPPQTVEGAVGLDLKNGVDVNLQNNTAESSLIKEWDCTIIDNSNGNVGILGKTLTYSNVDYLDVQVFLQRWNGSNWVDVTSRTYSINTNSYVSGSAIISATRGATYRCRAVHTARKADSSNDTRTSVTSAIVLK